MRSKRDGSGKIKWLETYFQGFSVQWGRVSSCKPQENWRWDWFQQRLLHRHRRYFCNLQPQINTVKLLIIDSREKCFSTDILTRPKVREFSTLNLFISLMIFPSSPNLPEQTEALENFISLILMVKLSPGPWKLTGDYYYYISIIDS